MVRVLIILACMVGGIHLYFYLTTGTFEPCKAAAVRALKLSDMDAAMKFATNSFPLACYAFAILGPFADNPSKIFIKKKQ